MAFTLNKLESRFSHLQNLVHNAGLKDLFYKVIGIMDVEMCWNQAITSVRDFMHTGLSSSSPAESSFSYNRQQCFQEKEVNILSSATRNRHVRNTFRKGKEKRTLSFEATFWVHATTSFASTTWGGKAVRRKAPATLPFPLCAFFSLLLGCFSHNSGIWCQVSSILLSVHHFGTPGFS